MTVEPSNVNLPFPDLFWVEPGRLLAGEYPGAIREVEARKKIIRLVKAGVDTCIDLTKPGELVPYEELFLEQVAEFGREGRFLRFPIQDGGLPQTGQMRAILAEIDLALSANHTVYVHCWGGIGRTGMVVACYLVNQGMENAAALHHLQALRAQVPDAWRPSPETPEQWEFVMHWGKHGS